MKKANLVKKRLSLGFYARDLDRLNYLVKVRLGHHGPHMPTGTEIKGSECDARQDLVRDLLEEGICALEAAIRYKRSSRAREILQGFRLDPDPFGIPRRDGAYARAFKKAGPLAPPNEWDPKTLVADRFIGILLRRLSVAQRASALEEFEAAFPGRIQPEHVLDEADQKAISALLSELPEAGCD